MSKKPLLVINFLKSNSLQHFFLKGDGRQVSFFLSEDEYTRKKGEGESGKIKCKNFFFILITLHVLFALGLQTLLKGTKNWFIVLCAGIAFSRDYT